MVWPGSRHDRAVVQSLIDEGRITPDRAGGPDNVTCVVARVEERREPSCA
jgi:serine/threonine protein phosphatase PrpC